ncbi:hypothetical protein DIE06_31165 [Burkholderia sp. Bp8998]|nr:hypothetical protein DIE06_31165 [Burkholderia sp. Bp8998]
MKEREIYVVGAARTAIGTFGGSIAGVPPSQLAVTVVRELLRRSEVDPARVGRMDMGNVIPTQDTYIGCVVAIESAIPEESNRAYARQTGSVLVPCATK